MDLTSAAFVLSILVAATATVISDFKRQKLLTYFFRPFTVALMMGFLLEVKRASPYRNIVLAALFFCLVGEIAMMLRKKIFQAGLVSFLISHILFCIAFCSRLTGVKLRWPVIPLVFVAAIILFLTWPNLGRLRLPILIYILVILTMVRLALELPYQVPEIRSWLAAGGALLFLTSDSVLALNRFYRSFCSAQIIILSTFYLALLFITLSV